jgi:hypothetical protein
MLLNMSQNVPICSNRLWGIAIIVVRNIFEYLANNGHFANTGYKLLFSVSLGTDDESMLQDSLRLAR